MGQNNRIGRQKETHRHRELCKLKDDKQKEMWVDGKGLLSIIASVK